MSYYITERGRKYQDQVKDQVEFTDRLQPANAHAMRYAYLFAMVEKEPDYNITEHPELLRDWDWLIQQGYIMSGPEDIRKVAGLNKPKGLYPHYWRSNLPEK